MAGQPEGAVDWAEIEPAIRGGASPSALARVHGVSRRAIEQRAKRKGWAHDPSAAALTGTDTAQRIITPQTRHDRRLISDGKRTLSNMKVLLEEIQAGGTRKLAALRIGITTVTLAEWMKGDEEFARLVVQAEAECALRRAGQIEAAGARGDWKAPAYLLERSPVTREEFAARPLDTAGSDGAPSIQLVFRPFSRNAARLRPRRENSHRGAPHPVSATR